MYCIVIGTEFQYWKEKKCVSNYGDKPWMYNLYGTGLRTLAISICYEWVKFLISYFMCQLKKISLNFTVCDVFYVYKYFTIWYTVYVVGYIYSILSVYIHLLNSYNTAMCSILHYENIDLWHFDIFILSSFNIVHLNGMYERIERIWTVSSEFLCTEL